MEKISSRMVYLRRLRNKKDFYIKRFKSKKVMKQESINIIKKVINKAKNPDDILFFKVLLKVYEKNFLDLNLKEYLENGNKEDLKKQLEKLYERKLKHIERLKNSKDVHLIEIYKKNYDEKYLKNLEIKDKQVRLINQRLKNLENKVKEIKENKLKKIMEKAKKFKDAENKIDNAKNIDELQDIMLNLNLELANKIKKFKQK